MALMAIDYLQLLGPGMHHVILHIKLENEEPKLTKIDAFYCHKKWEIDNDLSTNE